MTVKYEFRKLDRCFPNDDVKKVRVSGTLLRDALVAQERDLSEKVCRLTNKSCQIVLSLEHTDLEHAEYTSHVTLESLAGGEAQEETSETHVSRCTSLVRITLCDP